MEKILMSYDMLPAMSSSEAILLEKYLKNSKQYFEFGSGGSTLLAAKVGVTAITSVESSMDWINMVKESPIVAEKFSKNEIRFISIDINANSNNWGYPKDDSKKDQWHLYSEAVIGNIPDLILVDGRFRVACCLQSYHVMDENSRLMIHDYNSRDHYHIIEDVFDVVESVESLFIFKIKLGLNSTAYRYLPQYLLDAR